MEHIVTFLNLIVGIYLAAFVYVNFKFLSNPKLLRITLTISRTHRDNLYHNQIILDFSIKLTWQASQQVGQRLPYQDFEFLINRYLYAMLCTRAFIRRCIMVLRA